MSAPPPDYPDYPGRTIRRSFTATLRTPRAIRRGAIRSRATAHRLRPPPNPPPPGYGFYPPPGYPPAGHTGPPPGYGSPPPGYPPAPGYALPPGYGVPPPQVRGTLAPGIIPLRPLSLSDIFNGAAVYIRANPKATLGLTAIIVVITQIITLIAAAGPLAAASRLRTAPPDELTGGDVAAWTLSAALTGLIGWLAGILLTGMLTVVVGRAVFGSTIGAGETWAKIRGRLPALVGLVVLESAGLILLAGLVGLIVGAIAAAGNARGGRCHRSPAGAGVDRDGGLLVHGAVVCAGAHRAGAAAGDRCDHAIICVGSQQFLASARHPGADLGGGDFDRGRGRGPVQLPWSSGSGPSGPEFIGATVGAVGSAIGRIITSPFSAGVVVLLYTDRRIRAEAFDLVLQTGAAAGPARTASTDYLWLTRPV